MERPTSPTAATRQILAEAKSLVGALPDILFEARRVAATILAGWHGRRCAGPGETFWQFRPYSFGEPAANIDWRRSARDDHHLYVREMEREAAQTVWLSPDLSPSMDFRSRLAQVSKRDRGTLIALALAELLARAGERVGLFGHTEPVLSRNAAETLGMALANANADAAQDGGPLRESSLRRHAEVVLISDFLDPIDDLEARFAAITAVGARGHLIQILDPIEETFPYAGRTEFRDPETGLHLLAGRAESYRRDYMRQLSIRRDRLALTCRRLDWTFLVHRTDRAPTEPLLALFARLGDRGRIGRGRAA